MTFLSITGGITGGVGVALVFFAGVVCGAVVVTCMGAAFWLGVYAPADEEYPLVRPIDCFTNPELFTPADAISVAPKDGGRNA